MVLGCLLVLATTSSTAAAQDDVVEPSRIGPFAIDLRGTFPGLPQDQTLAASRGLRADELPSRAKGVDAGAHVYLFKWKAVTVGVGAQLTLMRASGSPETPELGPVDVRLTSFTPQLSLNFGTGDGWSYLSAGLGTTTWSIVPDRQPATPHDDERLRTLNYGGGARWFFRRHLAFTFDVRFHRIDPGSAYPDGRPAAPRTRLFVMGAGISVR